MKNASALLLVLAFFLAACASPAVPSAQPNPAMDTAIAAVWTQVAGTPSALPTLFVTAPPSASSASYGSVTPRPDQQTYSDPAGWYSLAFPANMDPAGQPNAFATRDGDYLETGYLAELGYMTNILNVCAWLANIELDPTQSMVDWSYLLSQNFDEAPQCSVLAKTSPVDNIQYQVYENPAAAPAQRFAYVKTGWNSFRGQSIPVNFSWMKATSPRLEPSLTALTPEETALWERLAPTLQGISVTEYTLPPGADPNREEIRDLPEAAKPDWESMRAALATPEPPLEAQLQALGYELRQTDTGWKQLYRDGRLLFDFVVSVSQIYRFTTAAGPVTAFIVNTRGASEGAQTSFLIQNDTVNAWDYNHQDPLFAPILHRDEILWVKASQDFNQIRVINSARETVFTYAVSTEPVYAVSGFTSWNGHWILSARDFLIQDGEILNEKLGLEEIFSWGLLEGKPVYLFRKGARIGVSYDGKIAPLNYQDVTRYRCCGYAVNNPIMDGDSLHFYGKRDGIWYYVKVEFY